MIDFPNFGGPIRNRELRKGCRASGRIAIDLKRKALGIDKARERVLFDMEMRRQMADAAHAEH